MASDYDSKLISRLYNAGGRNQVLYILEEMSTINNPIFIRPIVDAYYKYQSSAFSHYFLSALQKYSDPDVLNAAAEILSSTGFRIMDLTWLLPIFKKFKVFSKDGIELIATDIKRLAQGQAGIIATDKFELDSLLDYLKAGEGLLGIRDELEVIMLDKKHEPAVRAIALKYLIRTDPAKELKKILDNYKIYAEADLEIIIAREIVGWNKGNAELLKQKILKDGYGRAKEIVNESIKINKEKNNIVEEIARQVNLPVILNIIQKRDQINKLALVTDGFGFEIFPQNERIVFQIEAPESKDSFISYCKDLRSYIQDLSPKLFEHSLSEDEVKRLLSCESVIDTKKSLNSLEIFMLKEGFLDAKKLYGIKRLNEIVNKAAHEEKELIKILKDEALEHLYTQGKWSDLYSKFLNMYFEALCKIDDKFRKKTAKGITGKESSDKNPKKPKIFT